MAYLARYAHQPLSELLALSLSDLAALTRAVERLVERENKVG